MLCLVALLPPEDGALVVATLDALTREKQPDDTTGASVLSDRAVVAQGGLMGSSTEVWVLRLSTGAVHGDPPGADGALLGRLDGRRVVGFSWDSELAITTDDAGGGTPRLIRWGSGQVVWSANCAGSSAKPPWPPGNSTTSTPSSVARAPAVRLGSWPVDVAPRPTTIRVEEDRSAAMSGR